MIEEELAFAQQQYRNRRENYEQWRNLIGNSILHKPILSIRKAQEDGDDACIKKIEQDTNVDSFREEQLYDAWNELQLCKSALITHGLYWIEEYGTPTLHHRFCEMEKHDYYEEILVELFLRIVPRAG